MGARRGSAVMMALMVTTLMFVLGVGLLAFLRTDSEAALVLQRTQKALMVARSGIHFARYCELNYIPSPLIAGGSHFVYALDADGLEQFEIWKDSDADLTVHSVGTLKDSRGVVLARRELASPTMYPGSPTSMNTNIWDVDL